MKLLTVFLLFIFSGGLVQVTIPYDQRLYSYEFSEWHSYRDAKGTTVISPEYEHISSVSPTLVICSRRLYSPEWTLIFELFRPHTALI